VRGNFDRTLDGPGALDGHAACNLLLNLFCRRADQQRENGFLA